MFRRKDYKEHDFHRKLSIDELRILDSIIYKLNSIEFKDLISTIEKENQMNIASAINSNKGDQVLFDFVKRRGGKIHIDIYLTERRTIITISFPKLFNDLYGEILNIFAKLYFHKNIVNFGNIEPYIPPKYPPLFISNIDDKGITYTLESTNVCLGLILSIQYITFQQPNVFSSKKYD